METNELQQVEFAVAGSEAKGLYDILQGAMTWPKPSTSVGPPLLMMYRWVPTAMILHPTAQEPKAPSPVPKHKGVTYPLR